MRSDQIKEIVVKAQELGSAVANLIATVSKLQDAEGKPFDTRKTVKGTDSSVAEVAARILATVGVLSEFEKAKDPEMVPTRILTQLAQSISETLSATNSLSGQLIALDTSHGGVQSFDYTTFQVLTKNGASHALESYFATFHTATEALLVRFFESVFILKPRASYSFQAAANGLSRLISTINEDLSSAREAQKSINSSKTNLEQVETEALSTGDEIKRIKTESESERRTISEYLSKATENSASISSVNDEASALLVTTRATHEALELFDKKLNDRNEKFEKGSKELADLISKFNDQRDGVEDLIIRAESMLSSSTVAGLAAHFSTIRQELTDELWWARFGFYFSILVLIISAIPLFAIVTMPVAAPLIRYLFPEIHLPDVIPQTAVNSEWQYIAQVLGRILILLPAAWLVRFAAIRHSSLFRLREHYAYKYSMAVSVEGFKKQAPDYEQQIAALVLEQLAFNPADKLIPSRDIKEGKAPGLMGILLDKIRGEFNEDIANKAL